MGVDGIKTGYLSYEKYSLASSIFRNGRRLISVASGFETKNSRSKESAKLLTYGITNFDTVKIAKRNERFGSLEVWLGRKSSVDVYTNEDIYKTIPKGRKKYLKVKAIYTGPVEAPIKKNDSIAKIQISYKDELISEHELLAAENIKRMNIFSRIINSINYLIWGDV